MYQASSLFTIFRASTASTVIPLLPKATFTPPSPSTPFWPYDYHPFFPHDQTISIFSNLIYSLTQCQFQPSYAPLHSSLYPFVTLQPNYILKHFISRTFTFIFSAHLIPHAPAPYNAGGTITPSYRQFVAFIHGPQLFSTL